MQNVDHLHTHEHNHRTETQLAWLKIAILFGMGLYFAYNILSGNLSNYINLRFAWLSYLAAGLFFVLAASGAFSLWRHGHDTHHDHADHTHRQLSWGAIAIVAIPLLLGTLIPSQPLGAEAIDGNITTSGVSATDTNSFTINPLQRNILDWLRVFNASPDLSTFNGQQATIIGFIYREPTFPEHHFMVARFTISCCVADSSAIGLPVFWDGVGDFEAGDWIQIIGTFQLGEFRGDSLPILQAETVEQVEQPAHPYLYP